MHTVQTHGKSTESGVVARGGTTPPPGFRGRLGGRTVAPGNRGSCRHCCPSPGTSVHHPALPHHCPADHTPWLMSVVLMYCFHTVCKQDINGNLLWHILYVKYIICIHKINDPSTLNNIFFNQISSSFFSL